MMKKKRLLIIEDEISVAKQLKWGFGEEYEINIASEADQARPLLAAGLFRSSCSTWVCRLTRIHLRKD